MRFAGNKIFIVLASVLVGANASGAVELGIDVLESNGYALLKNKRVGLVTNQTRVDSRGVRAQVLLRKNCNLVALYAPEHGLDGTLKAGRYVRSHRDPMTGLTGTLALRSHPQTNSCDVAASIHSSSIFRTSGAAVTPTSAR